MRYVYLSLVLVVSVMLGIFALQNLGAVTVGFITYEMNLPLSLLLVGVYLLGMLTGGALLTVLRRWWRQAQTSEGAIH